MREERVLGVSLSEECCPLRLPGRSAWRACGADGTLGE